MSKKTIILFLLGIAGVFCLINIFIPKASEKLGGDVIANKVIVTPAEKPKTISLKEVRIDEGIVESSREQLVKIDLYNQLKSQKAIGVIDCTGKEFITCINESVNTALKEYQISEVPIKYGSEQKSYVVNLSKVQ